MKRLIVFLLPLLLFGKLGYGNMASPYQDGTRVSNAFSSKQIDILHELIHITVQDNLQEARFQIEYTIHSLNAGRQIPFLFVASDYKKDFLIWVDNKPIQLQSLPDQYLQNNISTEYLLSNHSGEDPQTVQIQWDKNENYTYNYSDLKFLETDLDTGYHSIRIEYTAFAGTDRSDWLKKYDFRYSLTPAKYWKSFGTLQVYLEYSQKEPFFTNLGKPNVSQKDGDASWTFSALPDEFINIRFEPEATGLSAFLLILKPAGIALIMGVILILLQMVRIFRFKKNNPSGNKAPFLWGISLLAPVIILATYMFSFSFIDAQLGIHASKFHGYTFMVFIYYPLLVLGFWALSTFTDWIVGKTIS